MLRDIEEHVSNSMYKRAEMDTQDAVLEKQKELLGKDDLSGKHSYQELKEMLRELTDEHNGNEATRNLEMHDMEYQNVERQLEKFRRKTNDLNSKKGKLEAESEAHNQVLTQRFKIVEAMHRKHQLDMDSLTQDMSDEEGTLTQGTATSRMSRNTIFTSATSSTGVMITKEDLEVIQRGIEAKNVELTNNFNKAKKQHREDEDAMQKSFLELQANKQAVDNDRKRNDSTKNQAMRELTQISSQMSSSLSRVRKSDVDDAKRQAGELAKQRDNYNKHPRREEITKDIRVLEDRLKSIAVTIEQDTKIRDQLRLRSNEQNEIDMLEKQVAQEYDVLTDLLKENSYLISSQGEDVRVTRDDPIAPVEVLHNNVRNKLLKAQDDVERCNSVVGDVQKKVSEKQALVNNHRNRFTQLTQKNKQLMRDGGGVEKIKSIIRAILRLEKDHGIDLDRINDDTTPSELLKYIAERVKELSEHEERPEQITKIIKRLKKMSKNSLACPCCEREWTEDKEFTTFHKRMSELADPLVSELHFMANKKSKETSDTLQKYEHFRRSTSENMSDYLEYTRVLEELKELENLIKEEEGGGYDSLNNLETDLKTEENALKEKKELAEELQTLSTTVNGIQDSAKRVWEKMGNVKEKRERLKYQFMGNVDDPRDLKTVEKDLAKSSDQKEVAYTNINKLNNEQKQLNEKISRVTNQAATAERSARDKEDTYKRDQESTKRKEELNEQLKKLSEEDKDLDRQLVPLRTQLMQKESDRNRMRDTNAQEDRMLSEKLKVFERDVDKLKDVSNKIEQYERSDKVNEIGGMDQKLRENAENIQSAQGRLAELKPVLENLKKQVEDGERQKKTIQDNINLMKLKKKVDRLKEEVEHLEGEIAGMGKDAAEEQHQSAAKNVRELGRQIERYGGRMQGLDEQKRQLKRKLNEPEYKGVDARQQMKMIEHETTNIVVSDLDKYYDALDKALLRYHGMKINDINKIIRELWALTYKGEDITNLEIQSGQESGSRANKSYNYRIVMSKGNTQMDMRGRCSAGQRVLASIVIRLALAETFCLNCGVMALDEPTTNLDYENKRGLGIALAQIIASRAAQSNFQLVVITHDEDFVSMMKQELSTQTGFNMPERYYQVSREEGLDGKFYSKIGAVDWDDL